MPVPVRLRPQIATIHFGAMPAGLTRGPTFLPQIWVSSQPVWWLGTGDVAPQQLPAVALVGPTSAAVGVFMKLPMRFPGWSFWPRGWAEIVKIPAEELRDQALDASLLWKVPCMRLLEGLSYAQTDAATAAAMTRFAADLCDSAKTTRDQDNISIIDGWLAAPTPIDELSRSLCLSRRQTERVVARTHGFSPRLMGGKHRALRAAARLGLHDLHTPALWDEYADQSHFTREFRRFVGMTPGEFLRAENLARDVLASEWQLESDHPLSLIEAE